MKKANNKFRALSSAILYINFIKKTWKMKFSYFGVFVGLCLWFIVWCILFVFVLIDIDYPV